MASSGIGNKNHYVLSADSSHMGDSCLCECEEEQETCQGRSEMVVNASIQPQQMCINCKKPITRNNMDGDVSKRVYQSTPHRRPENERLSRFEMSASNKENTPVAANNQTAVVLTPLSLNFNTPDTRSSMKARYDNRADSGYKSA